MTESRLPIPISDVVGARYTLLADGERRYAVSGRREASTLEIAWRYRDREICVCRSLLGKWRLEIRDGETGITAVLFTKPAPNAESGYRFAVEYIDRHWPSGGGDGRANG